MDLSVNHSLWLIIQLLIPDSGMIDVYVQVIAIISHLVIDSEIIQIFQ